MKKLLWIPLLLIFNGLAFGQNYNVPPCTGAIGPTCTDYFGVANYANSPLPVGAVGSITVVTGGSGYVAPVVTITDFYNTPGAGGATAGTPVVDPLTGAITSIPVGSPGSGYMAPVVTITDVAGTGAIVYATLNVTTVAGTGMRKFVDTLTLPLAGLPLAVPDTITYPGSDYYEIALTQYTQKMHTDLPLTTLRGYVQTNLGTDNTVGSPTFGTNVVPPPAQSYLGPVILAQKNRPVRVKFTNRLGLGALGDLFIPVDTTYMGAGAAYTENRATLHLHGGNTPWISDGTPHQWVTPVGETAPLLKGDSFQNVPDMVAGPNCAATNPAVCVTPSPSTGPSDGVATFYWTNQQGGRLMFYHDHAFGITRLNVYVGEAAGYLLVDPAEEDALAAATVPGTISSAGADLAHLIPLVIQDKSFVPGPDQLLGEDPTWTSTHGGGTAAGNLWFPHVYMTNQNPADLGGANAFGRWDYGPWFFPPQTSLTAAQGGALTVPCTSSAFPNQTVQCPIILNPSGTPESFMDTPMVNGVAYPVLHVAPAAYRFKILSAGNDRTFNLSLWKAFDAATNLPCAGVPATPAPGSTAPSTCTEVKMVPFNSSQNLITPFPTWWYTVVPNGFTFDDRAGGVPDPTYMGPPFIQIGTEGGLLPAPAVVRPQPINYVYNRRDITVGNVNEHALLLGPAERADVIVDFSAYAGKTLTLYNDGPAPVPASDPRLDYFTGGPDQVDTGGAPSTLPGYGPNTRTIMQIVVDQTAPNTVPFSLAALQGALPDIFAATQPVPIVPEPTYPVASGGNSATATYAGISDNTITYTPVGATAPVTINYGQKAIQELFTLDYGRMNATLGVEMPLTNFLTQTTIPYGYNDPPTEIIQDAQIAGVQPQLWKITHNGVDTHFIHFHLFNVQVINRVGWDGAKRPPDANELGWKDTVRMNPLEDIVVALQPLSQTLPFPIPDSIRLMDVTGGGTFTGVDPNNLPVTILNNPVNFGWEYVWHCHILGHEENDMMRPIIFQVAPPAPSNLVAAAAPGNKVALTWTDNSASETAFILQRAEDSAFTLNLATIPVGPSTPNTAYGGTLTYTDAPVPANAQYFYRVQAFDDFTPTNPLPAPWQAVPLASAWSNTASIAPVPIASVSPTSLTFAAQLVGTTSPVQTVTLSNSGGVALVISTIGVTGTNAADYLPLPTSANPCPIGGTGLATGASCTIDVQFKPAAVGASAASLTINSNDPVHPTLTVALSGTGALPIAGVSPLTLTFGPLLVGQTSPAQTVTLSNTGGVALTISSVSTSPTANFAQTNTCGATFPATLAANSSCAISVTFTATSAITPVPGTLTITDNSNGATIPPGTTQTVTLSGAAVTPVASVSPATLTFASQAVGTTSPAQTVTVFNTGSAPLTFTVNPLTGANPGDFALTNTCTGTLLAPASPATSTSCAIFVTFKPSGANTRAATLTISTNDLAHPTLTVSLSGTGTAVTITPASLLFGNQVVNTTSLAQTVTLTNTGTTQLTSIGITITGANANQFARTTTCGTSLAANSSCIISVTFRPTTTGVKVAALSVADSDPTSPQTVPLSGTGVTGPAVSLSPTSLNLGRVTVGQTSAPQTVTLTNTGGAPLTINSITTAGTSAGDFARAGGTCATAFPATLAAGANCTIGVTFKPTKKGNRSANLAITDNAAGSPQTVALSGQGR